MFFEHVAGQFINDSAPYTFVLFTDCESVLTTIRDFHNRKEQDQLQYILRVQMANFMVRVEWLVGNGLRVICEWVRGHSEKRGHAPDPDNKYVDDEADWLKVWQRHSTLKSLTLWYNGPFDADVGLYNQVKRQKLADDKERLQQERHAKKTPNKIGKARKASRTTAQKPGRNGLDIETECNKATAKPMLKEQAKKAREAKAFSKSDTSSPKVAKKKVNRSRKKACLIPGLERVAGRKGRMSFSYYNAAVAREDGPQAQYQIDPKAVLPSYIGSTGGRISCQQGEFTGDLHIQALFDQVCSEQKVAQSEGNPKENTPTREKRTTEGFSVNSTESLESKLTRTKLRLIAKQVIDHTEAKDPITAEVQSRDAYTATQHKYIELDANKGCRMLNDSRTWSKSYELLEKAKLERKQDLRNDMIDLLCRDARTKPQRRSSYRETTRNRHQQAFSSYAGFSTLLLSLLRLS